MNLHVFRRLEAVLLFLAALSWIMFYLVKEMHRQDYLYPIDPVDEGYTPFASAHLPSLIFYFFASFWSSYHISTKGSKLPPLLVVIYIAFMLIGALICIFMIIQVADHFDKMDSVDEASGVPMILAPFFHVLLTIVIFLKFIHQARERASTRVYTNRFLNFLNHKLVASRGISIWTIIVVLPILLVITLILCLFGQEPDSLVKVFTETTTWTFSQKTHPEFLDHKGHYLCTVAACGSPNIVKPQRTGIRHGNEIIVNRQLMIANAFEELIQEKAPRFHRWIRKNYDHYGYPLSKKITRAFWSNVTYIAMKPLEWVFLLVLYLFSVQPEARIRRQYA